MPSFPIECREFDTKKSKRKGTENPDSKRVKLES